MTLRLFMLILFSVSLSAIAQIALKTGMSSPRIQSAIQNAPGIELAWGIATNWRVVLGLALYFLGALVWLLVLARVDVTMAYPFVGLGFILTMILGAWFLSEPVSTIRIVGTLLVVAGVALISQS
jgi:drug/metabolite transporter (DMT)-like permease